MATCDICDGDGKAHGSDRPFEYSGPGTYPGPCPKCHGTGTQEGEDPELEEEKGPEWVYCHECSLAGGADRPIFHDAPACTPAK